MTFRNPQIPRMSQLRKQIAWRMLPPKLRLPLLPRKVKSTWQLGRVGFATNPMEEP